MKKKCKTIAMILVFQVLFFLVFSFPVSAHNLSPWADYFCFEHAMLYGFYLDSSCRHIDGNVVQYNFSGNAEDYYGQAVPNGIAMWGGLISGQVTSLHRKVVIKYVDTVQADGTLGTTYRPSVSGSNYHLSFTSHATITFYKFTQDESGKRALVAAHEIGHLYGLKDMYNTGYDYSSTHIMGKASNMTGASSSDRNGLRIGLANYWCETGVHPYCYRYSETYPDRYYFRSDVNHNNSIDAEDARLILKYAAGQITFTSLQQKLSEVTGDGIIDASDARLVLRVASGLENKYPVDALPN